jgi:hypothetical protein
MERSKISEFFREYKLDYLAIEYIKGNIHKYGLSFGAKLLQQIDFATGEVTTFAPVNINDKENRLEQFEYGHLLNSLPQKVREASLHDNIQADFDLWLAPMVQQHLESSRNALCVFTDIDVKPNHPIVKHSFMRPIIFQNEVYFLLTKEHSTMEDIDTAFCEVGSWSLVCALTLHSELDELTQKSNLGLQDLNILTTNVQKVIVMAYDGEGYLVWHKV